VPGYFDEQPMSRVGIAVDDELRPLGADGARAVENVLVAGASLAGATPWKEKSGDGISLATGHRAAELILAAGGAPAGLATASRRDA
jgi:glycerol-3-phosphate dehydrogenase subunit B